MLQEPIRLKSTTRREKQILWLLSEGNTTREIASSLYISSHTVETHRKSLITKFNAKNSIHMVAMAARMGLI